MSFFDWTTLGQLADVITLVGFPIAILALLWTYRQLRWMYSQISDIEKTTNLNKQRETLRQAITNPSPKIRSFGDVYSDLIGGYAPTLGNDGLPFSAAYLEKTVGAFFKNGIRFSGQGKVPRNFHFPLAGKRQWMLSENQRFEVVGGLHSFDRVELTDHAITSAVNAFIDRFQIGSFAAFLQSSGRKLWDNPTFDITDFTEQKDRIDLKFQVGSYSNYVRTHEIMRHELYYHYVTSGSREIDPTKLDIRKSFGISHFNDLFKYRKRPATLGLSIFPIFYKGNGCYCTFLHKRSDDLVENPGVFHVVPSGTFQPLSIFDESEIKRQCSFSYTTLRELLEELYNLEGADKSSASNPFHIFRLAAKPDFVPGQLLIPDMYFSENVIPAEIPGLMLIKPTAFFINLVPMKPELTLVLLVRDQEVYQKSVRAFHGNWEGSIKEFEIFPNSEKLRVFLEYYLNVSNFLPAGAVAIAEGLDYFSKYVQTEIPDV